MKTSITVQLSEAVAELERVKKENADLRSRDSRNLDTFNFMQKQLDGQRKTLAQLSALLSAAQLVADKVQ